MKVRHVMNVPFGFRLKGHTLYSFVKSRVLVQVLCPSVSV